LLSGVVDIGRYPQRYGRCDDFAGVGSGGRRDHPQPTVIRLPAAIPGAESGMGLDSLMAHPRAIVHRAVDPEISPELGPQSTTLSPSTPQRWRAKVPIFGEGKVPTFGEGKVPAFGEAR
jgi:hypothetical protein